MADKVTPELLHAAKYSPILRSMIKYGEPLTRARFVTRNWPDGPPKTWTAEHEMEVPEPFRLKKPDNYD